jgi:hypothetical protein
MASVFKSPKIPKAPDPVKTPTRDDAILADQQTDKALKRQGKASTILTGDQTRTQAGGNLKKLLGQ